MKLRRYLYIFIVSLCGIGVSWAQQAAPAPKKVVIRAGRMLDVKTGRLLVQQEIVIEGDKIKAVRTYDLSPSGEQFVDLSNATVLPGLIDAHTHITMTTNFGYSRLAISVPREALNGARNARVTLDAGFTTIRNVGARPPALADRRPGRTGAAEALVSRPRGAPMAQSNAVSRRTVRVDGNSTY